MTASEFAAMLDIGEPHGAAVPTLDDYTRALQSLRESEKPTLEDWFLAQKVPGYTVAAAPAVRKCADCGLARGEKCVAPQQPRYADLAGSESFSYFSTVRQMHCHGEWWVPR